MIDMRYIVIFSIISTFLISCVSSRTKVVQLEYYGENCLEESLTRVYLNDSIFVEYTNVIISPNDVSKTIDTFKVIDGKWYLKECRGYKIYFDSLTFERKDTLHLFGRNCQILFHYIPQEKKIKDGELLYQFKVIGQYYDYFAPTNWFNPKLGLVNLVSPSLPCENKYLKIISKNFLGKRRLKKLYQEINKK